MSAACNPVDTGTVPLDQPGRHRARRQAARAREVDQPVGRRGVALRRVRSSVDAYRIKIRDQIGAVGEHRHRRERHARRSPRSWRRSTSPRRASSSTACARPPRASTWSRITACRRGEPRHVRPDGGGQHQRRGGHPRPDRHRRSIPAPALFARSALRVRTGHAAGEGDRHDRLVARQLRRARSRLTYYGNVNQPASSLVDYVDTGKHCHRRCRIARVKLIECVHAGGGCEQPVRHLSRPCAGHQRAQLQQRRYGFPYYSPFGFNGRYLYRPG